MATNFKYASISDLNKYFNRVNDFDSKDKLQIQANKNEFLKKT